MTLDDTHTDLEFQRGFKEANQEWMGQAARREPDLAVDGLHSSLMSRLLSLFGVKDDR
ncbi:MAG TPA: hypothetical protein VIM81_09865 [Gammaproteobacteria bacterium]|jgi:hypothetical protein